MNLAFLAAIVAAAVSLAGIMINYRLTARSRLKAWRQDTELPIVANVLLLNEEALAAWGEAARVRAAETWAAAVEAFGKLRLEVRKLDLIADPGVRDACDAILEHHQNLHHWFRPASGADDMLGLYSTEGQRPRRSLVLPNR